MSEVQIVALIASHNRAPKTTRCVKSLLHQSSPNQLEVVLFDDGSTDGTVESIAQLASPRVTVLSGDGSYFWARGMATAEDEAIKRHPRFLLWVNDDAELDDDALPRLLSTAAAYDQSDVIAGAMTGDEGVVTYGGFRRASRLWFRLTRLPLSVVDQVADTANGNLLLVPTAVVEQIGGIDRTYRHSYADIDFGLRASRAGIRIVQAAGRFGHTNRNSPAGTFRDVTLPRSARFESFLGPKGVPLADHARFLHRHGGPFWFVQFIVGYCKLILRILLQLPIR